MMASTMDWLPYSLVATVLLGISISLWKMPTFRGYSSFHSTFWSNSFSVIFAVLLMILFGQEALTVLSSVSWYGLLWGVLFAINMLLVKILLERVETNTLLPLQSSLGAVLTVIGGLVLFSEKISIIQTIGVIIILVSVFLFSRKKGSIPLDVRSLSLGLGILLASTLSKFVQKLGAVEGSIYHYTVYQYLGAALFALVLIFIFERKESHLLFNIRRTWKMSATIGALSAFGGLAIVKALSMGPVSGVYAIHPAYVFISALVGAILYKEKLTLPKVILALLTILGVILIKIG
jgi:drug/metabolite transporter (DMT)-like permease